MAVDARGSDLERAGSTHPGTPAGEDERANGAWGKAEGLGDRAPSPLARMGTDRGHSLSALPLHGRAAGCARGYSGSTPGVGVSSRRDNESGDRSHASGESSCRPVACHGTRRRAGDRDGPPLDRSRSSYPASTPRCRSPAGASHSSVPCKVSVIAQLQSLADRPLTSAHLRRTFPYPAQREPSCMPARSPRSPEPCARSRSTFAQSCLCPR